MGQGDPPQDKQRLNHQQEQVIHDAAGKKDHELASSPFKSANPQKHASFTAASPNHFNGETPGLRWTFGQRSTSSSLSSPSYSSSPVSSGAVTQGQHAQSSAPTSQPSSSKNNKQPLNGSSMARTPTQTAHIRSKAPLAHLSSDVERDSAAASSSSRFPSPSKNSSTSDEEGMIREEDAEEGEVALEEGEDTSHHHRTTREGRNAGRSAAAGPSRRQGSPPNSIHPHPPRPGQPLAERFSTNSTSSLPPSRRWGSSPYSPSEGRPAPPTSRDLSRPDSYQPARYRSPDRDRERDSRTHLTPLRFPMTRSFDDAPAGSASLASPSAAPSAAPPPPLPPLDGRLGGIRAADSYRPGSNSLPSRPSVAHRTSSNGSLGDDYRSSSRREWERDRDRDRDRERERERERERDRFAPRRSASPDYPSRDDAERARRDRWRSNGDAAPPSPTLSQHSLPSVPRPSFGSEDSDARRALSGSNSRSNSNPWIAGANAQQMRYNRWGAANSSTDTKRDRNGLEERTGPAGTSLSSRLSEQPTSLPRSPATVDGDSSDAAATPRSRGLSQQFMAASAHASDGHLDDGTPRGSFKAASRPASPAPLSVGKSLVPARTSFEPPQRDAGWASRTKVSAGEQADSAAGSAGSERQSTAGEGAEGGEDAQKPLIERISGTKPASPQGSADTSKAAFPSVASPKDSSDRKFAIKEESSSSSTTESTLAPVDRPPDSTSLSTDPLRQPVGRSPDSTSQPSSQLIQTAQDAGDQANGTDIDGGISKTERPLLAEDVNVLQDDAAQEAAILPGRPEPASTMGNDTKASAFVLSDKTVVHVASDVAAAQDDPVDVSMGADEHTAAAIEPSAKTIDHPVPEVAVAAAPSSAPTMPAELQAQAPVEGAGETGTGLPTAVAALIADQSTPVKESIEAAEMQTTEPHDPQIAEEPATALEESDTVSSDMVCVQEAVNETVAQEVPTAPAPVLTDAVKDAVAVAEAVAADESMAEIEGRQSDLRTGTEDTFAKREAADIADEGQPIAEAGDVDEGLETRDTSEAPARRSRSEIEEIKQAATKRLLFKQDPRSTFSIDRIISANVSLSQQTTLSRLEPAIWGLPFQAPAEALDVYRVNTNDLQTQQIIFKRQCELNRKVSEKKERLRQQYKALNFDWLAHCERLDKLAELRENAQRSATQPNTPSTAQPTLADENQGPVPITPMVPTMGGRANRRGGTQSGFGFGDAVRSEAEFQEILASLESADMQDPEARAARTATTVPDQEINPNGTELLKAPLDDRNHFVAHPTDFYLNDFDPDYWSPEEKSTFARKYALWPKQFGRIATALPNKTAKQCVHYYYLTKHQPGHDYKAITAARNRNQKRKGKIKPKKAKGSALMADLKSARGDDLVEEEDGASSPMGSSGPRSRMLSSVDSGSGALGAVVGEEEAATPPSGAPSSSISRKRKGVEEGAGSVDVGTGAEKRVKGTGRGGRRVKGQGKKAAATAAASSSAAATTSNASWPSPTVGLGPLSTVDSPLGTPAENESTDGDIAAAEALGALSGAAEISAEQAQQQDLHYSVDGIAGVPPPQPAVGIPGSKGKKRKASGPVGEGADESSGARKPRNATSSYWSITERAEFLRAFAVHGKEWSTVSSTLGAKSAAQARNYFSRNAEAPEFVEAAEIAQRNANQPLSVREELAEQWSKVRLGLSEELNKGSSLASHATAPVAVSSAPVPLPVRKELSPELPRRGGGMGIMSLLNDEPAVKKRPSLQEWFGETPREEQDQKLRGSLGHKPDQVASARAPDRPYHHFSESSDLSTDSEAEGMRAPSRAHTVLPPRYPPAATAEPRPYLPEARGITAAPASRPPPPSLPGHFVTSSRATPSISIATSPSEPNNRAAYAHSTDRREEFSRYSHSPNYEARSQLSPILPISGSRSGVRDDREAGESERIAAYSSQTRRSPLYERGHPSSQAYERTSSSSGMAPPPPLTSQRSPSWGNTSSIRSGESHGRDDPSARHYHQSQGTASHSAYGRAPPSLPSSGHLGLPSPSSRSLGPSPYPSPGIQTSSPGAHSGGQPASSYLSARPYGSELAHRGTSNSPYDTSAYGPSERRPGTSGGLPESAMSARASPLPPPPLPSPGSREGVGIGGAISSSHITAAAAPPPAPPKLPPPSSLVRAGSGGDTQSPSEQEHYRDHHHRSLPPPPPGSSTQQYHQR